MYKVLRAVSANAPLVHEMSLLELDEPHQKGQRSSLPQDTSGHAMIRSKVERPAAATKGVEVALPPSYL